jgi:predicted aldo/keto reductase-like oxidoreductase
MSGSRDYCPGWRSSESSLNRRDFLRKASMAAVGVAAGMSAGVGSQAFAAEEALAVNGLPAAVFGRTGLKVTKISFGGILITEPPVLARAIDQGINLIHTAPGYQNGRSMEAFGKVMKTHRKKVVLALKVRPENLDSALKELNTDYVDILVPPMHSVGAIQDPSIPENFAKAKKAGKCGFMGFACHSHMADVLNKARELGYYDATLMSYGRSDSPEFLDAAKRAKEAGIGIMTMKGLPKRASTGLTPEEMKTVTSLCTSMVGSKHAHTVLASMGSFQAVGSYLDILQTKLGFHNPSLEQRYWADQQGKYCSNCGNCSMVCPSGEEISRIVRYRMYYKDYGLTDYARACYAELKPRTDPASLLENCKLCERVCSRGLPLAEMVREAHVLLS